MALNILKWRPTAPKFKVPNVGAIGEPDAHVFNCPKCARPLTEGTARCPGCATRLIMGVAARRASILIGVGFIIGVFLGGGVMSVVISTLINPAGTAAAEEPTDGTTTPGHTGPIAPGASGVPGVPEVPAAPAALSSLRQASLLDARMAADATALSKAYKSNKSGADLAPIMRSLASNASIGIALIPPLRTWDKAHALASSRNAFYTSVSAIALDGLRDFDHRQEVVPSDDPEAAVGAQEAPHARCRLPRARARREPRAARGRPQPVLTRYGAVEAYPVSSTYACPATGTPSRVAVTRCDPSQ